MKSSRGEAYSKFLEEFGPGFEIWRLDRHGIEFSENRLIRDEWLIHIDNMGDITFHSEKYRPYLTFVQEMFKEEYPERYNEIGDLLLELISTKREREGIITSSKELPFYAVAGIEMWLKNHMLLLGDSPLTRSSKLAIMISIIGHYEYGNKPLNLYQVLEREQFANTDNLYSLFLKYQQLMLAKGHVIAAREIAKTKQQIKTLALLLDGEIPAPSYTGIEEKLTIRRIE